MSDENSNQGLAAETASHARLRPLDIVETDGILRSSRHDDVYFSVENGLAETNHVFLDGTGLAARLEDEAPLVIAETGFGTGLNLAAVMALVAETGSRTPIDYISFEACPLTRELIAKAHAPFPEIKSYSTQIQNILPPRWPGAHFRSLMAGQIQLHLHYGEAEQLMPRLDFAADIWFLDGFSPVKNTDLWNADICKQIARLTAPSGRLATFSVASIVREGLKASGFEIEKRPGFGRKRDMLTAHMPIKDVDSLPATSQTRLSVPSKVAIIGGGIAGAAVAAGLQKLGIDHVIIERRSALARAASGNPLGLQSPKLRVEDHPISRLSVSAFSTAHTEAASKGAVISTGIIALDMPEREAQRHQRLAMQGWPDDLLHYLDADDVADKAGLQLGQGGLYFPHAHVIDPAVLTRGLAADSPQILNAEIEEISGSADEGWQLSLAGGEVIRADHLVLATGSDLPDYLDRLELPPLPLQITSGQLSILPEDNQMGGLAMALQYGGYIAADKAGHFIAGASFDRSANLEITQAAHTHNTALMPPALALYMPSDGLRGRVSCRLATSDRWPLSGQYAPGISILSALGARGLTLAPLLGEVLARQLAGRPMGLDREIIEIIDPLRFARRQAKRQQKGRQKKRKYAKKRIKELGVCQPVSGLN